MNLSQFTTWAINAGSVGKYDDGQFVGECVSLINQYCWRVLGVPARAWGHAKDWATNPTARQYFDVVKTSKRGDILVYDMGNIYGHIEIALSGDTALYQNRNGNRRVGQGKELNQVCLAILRPKNQSAIDAETSGGNDVETVKSMYWRLLGREADQAGINTYTSAAKSKGWEFVYNDLKNSTEGQNDWAWRNPERVRSLEKQLSEKPKEVVKEVVVEKEVIKEVPVEVIKEVEKVVEVPVEVIKEVVKGDDERTFGDLFMSAMQKLFKIK